MRGGGWSYTTKAGTFRIVARARHDGILRYHAMLDDEDLGNYANPEQALDDLVGGHTYAASSGVGTDESGLPDELSEWTFFL